jgi:hypothetical protein
MRDISNIKFINYRFPAMVPSPRIRRPIMTRTLALFITTASVLTPAAHAQTAAELSGTWESPEPQNLGQMHALGAFVFDGDTWSTTFHAFADAGTSQPLFTVEVGGTYVLGAPSEAVNDAVEAVFHVSRRVLTAEGEAGAALFGSMGCDIAAGETRPLVSEGCGFLSPVMQAGAEYDLVRVEGDTLTLGDRSADLSRERPAMLAAVSYVRR